MSTSECTSEATDPDSLAMPEMMKQSRDPFRVSSLFVQMISRPGQDIRTESHTVDDVPANARLVYCYCYFSVDHSPRVKSTANTGLMAF